MINKIFLVEEWWYDSYKLLGCYCNKGSAFDHINDLNFKKEYPTLKDIVIREIGLKTKKQLKKPYERRIWPR